MVVSIFQCVAFGLDRYCNLCANHSFSKQHDYFQKAYDLLTVGKEFSCA